MAPEKIDWNDFVKDMKIRFGTDESDWEFLRKAAVVKFEKDDRGDISGKYKGIMVFPGREYCDTFNAGDVWIVSLHSNPNGKHNYFAKPIQRLDASFLYDMTKDQVDQIADVLWANNRTALEPLMEERYRDILRESIDSAVSDVRSELEETISDLREKVSRRDQTIAEDRQIIESHEKEMDSLKETIKDLESRLSNREVKVVSEPVNHRGHDDFAEFQPKIIAVVRTGPDTITSEWFNRSRYYVNLSADHSMLLVRPDPKGNVVCMDGILELEGLNTVSPYDGDRNLPTEYSSHFGGAVVHLW